MKFIKILTLTVLFTINLSAQDTLKTISATYNNNLEFYDSMDSLFKYWLSFGVSDVAGQIDYRFSASPTHFFKVGYLNGNPKGMLFSTLQENEIRFDSYTFSYGRRYQSNWFNINAYGGIAYINGQQLFNNPDGSSKYEKFNSVGAMFDGQILFRIIDEVSVGGSAFYLINNRNNYSGYAINFSVGNGL